MKRPNNLALIAEINKKLSIKPLQDDANDGQDYTRVEVRKYNSLLRIKKYIKDHHKDLSTYLSIVENYAWLDINDSALNRVYITYYTHNADGTGHI